MSRRERRFPDTLLGRKREICVYVCALMKIFWRARACGERAGGARAVSGVAGDIFLIKNARLSVPTPT